MRTLTIGAVSFDVPDFLDLRDDEGTLVAYPPASDYANVRVSVSTVAKDGKPSPRAGERITRSVASKEQRDLHEKNGKVSYSYSNRQATVRPAARLHFGMLGSSAHDCDIVLH